MVLAQKLLQPSARQTRPTQRSAGGSAGKKCRSKDKVKEKVKACLKEDPEAKKTRDAALKADFAGTGSKGHDCKAIIKACTKKCFKPDKKTEKSQVKKVALDGTLTADKRTSVKVDDVEIPEGATPTLATAPGNDDDCDAPQLEIGALSGATEIDVGLDARGATEGCGDKIKVGIQVPEGAKVKKLKVSINSANKKGPNKKKAVKLAAPKGRRLQQDTSDSPLFTVADEFGEDVSQLYKACCFPDGYGVATTDADITACPKCATVNGEVVTDEPSPSPSGSPRPSPSPSEDSGVSTAPQEGSPQEETSASISDEPNPSPSGSPSPSPNGDSGNSTAPEEGLPQEETSASISISPFL